MLCLCYVSFSYFELALYNDVLKVSANGAAVNCTFLPGLVGTSGCVVSFGTSPDYLPYTRTSSHSGGSGQSVPVQLTINGGPLPSSTLYYYEARLSLAVGGHYQEVIVKGSFTTGIVGHSLYCESIREQ